MSASALILFTWVTCNCFLSRAMIGFEILLNSYLLHFCFDMQWSDQLQKLDFQELVMFLQHLPTQNWTHQELEMVLSRAYMWHSMFNSSPSHLAN